MKKIKRINIRISLNDYLNLIAYYTIQKDKYTSFSAYIRDLLELAHEYYQYNWIIEK